MCIYMYKHQRSYKSGLLFNIEKYTFVRQTIILIVCMCKLARAARAQMHGAVQLARGHFKVLHLHAIDPNMKTNTPEILPCGPAHV